ncbi:MAG: hypothetical protein J6P83_01485 [Bacteroidales bacterium]|nr:hypothetical protein [Bacteroidales bacterium]
MKKALAIVALIAAMFVAGKVQAQSMIYATYAPETFVAGNNSSNYQGFSVGFTQNFDFYQGIGVAAGAQFRMNTKSESSTLLGVTSTTKNKQFLVDVPILFNYGIAINRDLKVTPFVGPMLSLALAGNTKYTIGSSTTTTDWYGDNSNMNRFNLYAVFGADVKFNQFNLFGGYRLGLLDLNSSDNATLKTNGFFVGLGYSL